PARDDELAVARPVAFERRSRAVGGEAVALDDEPLIRPSGVELTFWSGPVDHRPGQAMGIDEREGAALEQAPGDGLAVAAVVVEDAMQHSGPSSPLVSPEQGIEGGRASEPAA